MTPDEVAVASLLDEIDRDASTIRLLLSEAGAKVVADVDDVVARLVQIGMAVGTKDARFQLTASGRRELWNAKGWEWGGAPGWLQERQQQLASIIRNSERTASAVHVSPSGRYSLEIIEFETGDGRWNVTQGLVRRTADNALLASVQRNYGVFPFSWCEEHPSGHDYLICGADYQGQTLVELDTGIRADYVPDAARSGGGFCWAAHYPTPRKDQLVVDGCYWACPYELVVYDFRTPLALPYQELQRWPSGPIQGDGFRPDGSLAWAYETTVRKADNKPLDALTDDETAELLDGDGYYNDSLLAEVRIQAVWHPGQALRTTTVPAK